MGTGDRKSLSEIEEVLFVPEVVNDHEIAIAIASGEYDLRLGEVLGHLIRVTRETNTSPQSVSDQD